MEDQQTNRELTLRGIVVPTEWSSRGEVLRTAILTPDEDQYDIAAGGVGRRLLRALREEVEARVRVDAVEGRRRSVTVLSYVVLDTFDPDDEILDDLLKAPSGAW